MAVIIDRRKNPTSGESINRERFLRRAKNHIKDSVKKSLKEGNITDIGKDGNIKIPVKDLDEPHFRNSGDDGIKDYVVPGNKKYLPGDKEAKPEKEGGGGSKGSDSGEGEDEFSFSLSREEFLKYLFDGLELPNLKKKSLKDTTAFIWRRSGYTNTGSPANLDVIKTYTNAMGRRMALRRPKPELVEELLEALEKDPDNDELKLALEEAQRKLKAIPWIDPIDPKFRHFEKQPLPKTHAVMFAVMDVSGSVTENMKAMS